MRPLLLATATLLWITHAHAAPIDLLRELVEINSGTANISGVNQVQERIADELKKLGFSVDFKTNPEGENKTGKLLVATRIGKTPRFVTLLIHADTVFEPSSPFQTFSNDGTKAFGPGVIDNKGGVVVALAGLKELLKDGQSPEYSIRVVSSPNEETGPHGFLSEVKRISAESALVLGLEPALEDGAIVESRRGNRWYIIRVTGKEAHAGRSHAEGINACVELSNQLGAIAKLTDYRSDATVSVGHISGGQDKFNIVCGSAMAKVDTRFSSISVRDRLSAKIASTLAKPTVRSHKTGDLAQISYEITDDCPPFSVSAASKPFIRQYLRAIEASEGKPGSSKLSGGSADTNYYSREGLPIMDGLGPVGGKMHTPDEFVVLSSLDSRAQALAAFLRNLKL